MGGTRRHFKGGSLASLRETLHNLNDAILRSPARFLVDLRKSRTPQAVSLGSLTQRIYSEFSEDRVLAVAGGITFFFLLSIFPAVACIVSLYGLFDARNSLLEGMQMVSGFLPGGAVSVLTAELTRLTAQKLASLNLTFACGLVVAVWSASGGVKSLIDGLNIAFETTETRSFLKLTLGTLLLTILLIALAAGAIYTGVTLQRFIAFRNNAVMQTAFNILMWPLGLCLCSAIVSAIYRYLPNRVRTPWKWIAWGSAFISFFWLLGTWLFALYAVRFGSFDRTYGVLGGAVGFLTWVWLSIVLLLTGAEIVCELDGKSPPKSKHRQ